MVRHEWPRCEIVFDQLDVDKDGYLEWCATSQVRTFARLIFECEALPMPAFPDSVWYQLWREFEADGNYTLDIDQSSFFVQHLYKRILHFYPVVVGQNGGAMFGKTPRGLGVNSPRFDIERSAQDTSRSAYVSVRHTAPQQQQVQDDELDYAYATVPRVGS